MAATERNMDKPALGPWEDPVLPERAGEQVPTQLELWVRDGGAKHEHRRLVDLRDLEVSWKKEVEAEYGDIQRNPSTHSPISSYAK